MSEDLEARILRELPHLGGEERRGLAHLVDILVREFAPERIYVFDSHARGDSGADSSVNLLVLLPDLPAPAHELDRRARAGGTTQLPGGPGLHGASALRGAPPRARVVAGNCRARGKAHLRVARAGRPAQLVDGFGQEGVP